MSIRRPFPMPESRRDAIRPACAPEGAGPEPAQPGRSARAQYFEIRKVSGGTTTSTTISDAQ